ncbi:hypothetical protein D3C72_2231290 [compost metagenome]
MAAGHHAGPLLFRVERIQDVQVAFARIAEHGVHAVFQQRPHHMLAAGHQFWSVVHRSFNQAARRRGLSPDELYAARCRAR